MIKEKLTYVKKEKKYIVIFYCISISFLVFLAIRERAGWVGAMDGLR